MRTFALLAGAAVAAATMIITFAPQSVAAPVCPGAGQPPVLVGQVPGAAFEGLTVDPAGRLYATDLIFGRVYRIDAPGAPAVPVAAVPGGSGAGALAWAPDGALLVGFGADPRVIIGDSLRPGAVARLDIATNRLIPFAAGLSAADGMDVARDGTIYATNDFGQLVGRVYPNGTTVADWTHLPSANGAVLGRDDAYLYVSRTFANPGVSRIPLANPGAVESLLTFTGPDVLAAPDGLTLDSLDRPVVPLNAAGQIIRIDAPGSYCVLAAGLPSSSVLSYGRGTSGFAQGHLYRAGFDGAIYEIPGGYDPQAHAATP